MRTPCLLLLLALTGCALTAWAGPDTGWSAEFLAGAAWNNRSNLDIVQAGHEDLDMDAEFVTEPWREPLYWALRLNRHLPGRTWSLELHHHKLILNNPPPEVDYFNVTHGTNIVSLQHAWVRPRWRYMVQAGVIIARPENSVRGLRAPENGGLFGGGYFLTGPALGAGVGTHLPLTDWLDFDAEARVTVVWVEVDVVGGQAEFRNTGLHLLMGPRVRF
ncbi:MAG: hypothetical protein GY838_03165 [bacterium]|nr:hypothetical protein [bacterium]